MYTKSKPQKFSKRLNFFAAITTIVALSVFAYAVLIQKPVDYEISEAANFPGDVNGDGVVNILDFQLLSNSFGKSHGQTGYDARCDFNGDNSVNVLDFQVLSNNFGKSGTVTSTLTPRLTATPTPNVTQGPKPTMSPSTGAGIGPVSLIY